MFTFMETRLFSRLVGDYLDEDEYARLQATLAANPDSGSVVPGSGGVRKIRWGQPGRGKQSGIRVIYYVKRGKGEIWMLTLYAKNETDAIPWQALRRIRDEIDDQGQA